MRGYKSGRSFARHPRMIRKVAAHLAVRRAAAIDSEEVERIHALHPRPSSRAECIAAERPCPWAGCRYHLWLDVKRADDGSETVVVNGRCDIDDMPETCALDCAERGGMTLEEIGMTLGVTRERVRQIELGALSKLRAAALDLFEQADQPREMQLLRHVWRAVREEKKNEVPD